MKFTHHSDEQACGKRVPGDRSDEYDALGGLACMRTAGHAGECISPVRDAGIADGVHWCCRQPLAEAHADWCPLNKSLDP